MSDLRSGTGGRERWSGEVVVGDSLTETEVGVDSAPEPTYRISRHENTGFSMESFMRMLAEMEENRDRRREEADRREEERERREQEREKKRGEEREAERERQDEIERKQEEQREAERQREEKRG